MRLVRPFFAFVVLVILGWSSFAGDEAGAVTFDVADGILLGASGIDVGGLLYDVEFSEGSCIETFDGCSDQAFAFTDFSTAHQAATSLLNQVLIDGASGNFFSDMDAIYGCGDGAQSLYRLCLILTPFKTHANDTAYSWVETANIEFYANRPPSPDPYVDGNPWVGFGQDDVEDTYNQPRQVIYAKWEASAIPEPSTALLLGLGLVGLGVRRRS